MAFATIALDKSHNGKHITESHENMNEKTTSIKRRHVTIDGNEAAAYVAHKLNEVIAIYPITPSSNMGEWADEWSAQGRKNLWGTVPSVTEMQSDKGFWS